MTQKFNVKSDKVPKDINAFMKLYTHHKTYEQYSQATDNICCPVLSISDCNFISESQFPHFLHS